MTKKVTPATLLCDFYKVSHHAQYPSNTQVVYSTWTPRQSRIEGVTHALAFGFQAFIKEYLIEYFDEHFFGRSKEAVVNEYKRYLKFTLGDPDPDATHIEQLHDLGYLPIWIKALPEGTMVPIKVPMLTIENTMPDLPHFFFWLTNYFETLMSCEIWQPTTIATIAFQYRKLFEKYAELTGADKAGVMFQGHDFAMRGMGGLKAAEKGNAGHLLSFVGTDTIPAIAHMEAYYNADIEKELVGTSIPATEHSVMCSYGREKELEAYHRLIEEVYPKGFLSIVSDTYDLWYVLDVTIRGLKDSILARDGRIVIRPDSGDPVKIILGDPESENPLAFMGVARILWDIFGGTINEKGFKVFDPHIGMIYGDAITTQRAEAILKGLMEMGFASTNMVFGIGSFTYQYMTRDTLGFALKSTYVVVDGEERNILKDPVTDSGFKKSATGRVAVIESPETGDLMLVDGLTDEEYAYLYAEIDLMETVFADGELYRDHTLAEIRERVASYL